MERRRTRCQISMSVMQRLLTVSRSIRRMWTLCLFELFGGHHAVSLINSICFASIDQLVFSVAPRCPTCQKPISKDRIVNDKALQTEIQSLEIFCNQKEKGCEWEGTLKDTPVHNETCLFVMIDCPNGCGAKFERRFTETHCKADCPKRTVNCEFCKF